MCEFIRSLHVKFHILIFAKHFNAFKKIKLFLIAQQYAGMAELGSKTENSYSMWREPADVLRWCISTGVCLSLSFATHKQKLLYMNIRESKSQDLGSPWKLASLRSTNVAMNACLTSEDYHLETVE